MPKGTDVLTAANALTLSRTGMIIPLVWCMVHGFWLWSAFIFTLAAVSDFYDGKLARHYNQTSPLGGLLDHGTDALLVTCGCWALANMGLIPMLLVFMIPAAFLQYMLDSKALMGQNLVTSVLGKSNGVAYFVLLGTGIGAHSLQVIHQLITDNVWGIWQLILAPGLQWAGWVLVVTTGLSMLDRLQMLLRGRM